MGRVKTLFFTLLMLLGSAHAAHAQEPITATSEATLLSEMPRRALFTVEATSSAGNLTEARVFFQPVGSSARVSEPVTFDPAPTIQLEHEWQMQTNGIPPGTEVESFWRLTDSAGNSFETPKQRTIFLDPRFTWQTVEDDELAISWYDGGADWGEEMFETGKEALGELENSLGTEVTRQVRLVAYGTNTDFRGTFPPQQDWIGGQAFTNLGVTVQIIGDGEQGWMRTVLFHELSHLVFAQAMEGALVNAPSWLEEGLAMYNEPDSRGSAEQVREAAKDDELLAFSQVQGNFGADGRTVGLAYAQSEMMVTYLIEDCGEDGFRAMVQNLVADMTMDDALEAACGYDSRTLYNNWRQTLPNAPDPTTSGGEEPAIGEPSSTDEGLPTWLAFALFAAFCVTGLILLAIIFVLFRLLRPQRGAS